MDQISTVGRRKASIARVFLRKGKGDIKVNGREYKEYFHVLHFADTALQPLVAAGMEKEFDILVNVKGGGFKGQAEATRLGIARALVRVNDELRVTFKEHSYMTRDARVVERKKPGLRKARKSDQFSKR